MCGKQQTACIHTPQTLVAPEEIQLNIDPLNTELNPICHLLALLGAHHIVHVSRIWVNGLKGRGILKECIMHMTVDDVRLVGVGVVVVCNRWRLRC